MNFTQIAQLLRDALAVVESAEVQRLFSDFAADVSGQTPPTPPVNAAAYIGTAQAQSANVQGIDLNNPAGQTIPPRAVR